MTELSTFQLALDLVIEHEITRITERLCAERRQRCRVVVRCLADGVELPSHVVDLGVEGDQSEGEARIVLRPGFKDTTVKVAYKVVIRGLAESTGFSGFSSEGRVDLASSSHPVRIPSVSYSYNKWRFTPPFDFADHN